MDSILKISELLHKSSLEATESVEHLLQAVRKAKVACNTFADVWSNNCFLESTKCSSPIPQVIGEQIKATNQLVSVSTYLSENGTFWCRLLEDFTYNEKLLNDISNKLWWYVKDSTAEVLHRVPLNFPIFHFSPTYNMYVRGIVINNKEKMLSVRYLDFGCAPDVSAETQFFLLPKEFQNQQIYQYQSLCCTLFNENIKIPYEGRRIFSDLTTNHVFKIEIKGSTTIPDSPYNQQINHVELRTIPGNKLINHEVMKKVKKHGKEVQKKPPEDLLLCSKNEKNYHQQQIPIALNSSITPVVLINCDSAESKKVESKPQMKFDPTCSVSKSSLFDGSIQKSNSLSNLNLKKVTNSKSVSLDLLPGLSNETDFVESSDKSSQNSEEKPEFFVNTIDQTNLISPDKCKQHSHPSKLPPLQNLLYNSTTPRLDPWQEIELMNISKLLKSQAAIKFFICAVSKKRILLSLKTKKLELKKDIFQHVPKNTSVYVILKEFSTQDQPLKDFYIGIAKVNVNQNYNLSQNLPTEKLNVNYLSLSCIPMFDQRHQNMHGYLNISLTEAKTVIEHYHLCLKKRTAIPFIKDIYPWCEDISHKTLQNEERSEQPPNKKSSKIIYLQKEDSQLPNSGHNNVDIENKLSISKMDNKNIESNVSMQNNGLPAEPESNIISLYSTIGRDDNDRINNENTGEFFPHPILQRPPITGYYDSTGMWFPEIHSAVKYLNSNVVGELNNHASNGKINTFSEDNEHESELMKL